MSLVIAFDTETTGLPEFRLPSGDDVQPHMVSLSAALFDNDTGKIQQSMSVIIKPDGWDIPQETTDIHGITNADAQKFGIPEKMALNMFLELWDGRCRIAHNVRFDSRIIRTATKRYSTSLVIDRWKSGEKNIDSYCTMLSAQKEMGGGKWPKLEEALLHFCGTKLKNAHNSWFDMIACKDIYMAIKGK
ncbi:MAG: 3'-5' exonuclease [Devosiaceae bacterium]|nr:3'-5' exonuclease [Devosiaceae bacterium]